ncbi:transcription factor HES-4-like [Oculina patagonica]
MEKAEILELTVNFLKMIREQQVTGYWTNHGDAESLSNYRAGFNECATKVYSFMENQQSGVDSKLREQMLARLAASCSYNTHTTTPVHVKSDHPVCYSPSPSVYGLHTTGESPCVGCASTPPPSPPSSAFSPFNRNEAAMINTAGNTSSISIVEPRRFASPVECSLPLWRPWMSNTRDGQS